MATYSAYINDNGTAVPMPASADTAAVAINKITTTLEADLTAGTAVSVPTHTVGSAKLQVFLDGVLCQPDDQYTDKTVTTIAFADTIPSGHVITAVAFTNATNPSDDMAAYIAALGNKLDKQVYENEKTTYIQALGTKLDKAVYEDEKTAAKEAVS